MMKFDVWSRRALRAAWGAALAVTLAACGGGGGGSGTPIVGPGSGSSSPTGGNATAADLTVQLSEPTIPNTGAGTVTATITALDANRNAVPNVPVTLSVNANAVLTVLGSAGSTTGSNGTLQATIGIGSDTSNRDITVSATAGSITRTAVLSVVSSPTGTLPTAIEITAGATHVGTGGDSVPIRAFVKGPGNNALASVPVTFTANTGTLSSVSSSTDESGFASAAFSAGSDKSNRLATITVSAGAVSDNIKLPIDGTQLTLSGPSSLIRNDQASFDVVLTDSRSNVVAGATVTATSALGNGLVAASGSNVSDSGGQVRFRYSATSSGSDSLVFKGAGVERVFPLAISGVNFAFTSPAASTIVAVNTSQALRVKLAVAGSPAGKKVSFAATGGTLSASSALTDASGEAMVSIKSASAGPITVQATVDANGDGAITTTTLPLVIAATVPSKLVLQATPTALAPNVGSSTASQAQVLAKVTDAAGNPVQGKTVNFSRQIDPSGGDLLQVSAVTDASGQARVAYRAGPESTANNGVVLSAAVADYPAVNGQTALTVNQTALFIALGTGNTISNVDEQTYRKNWVVYVTDANGIPVDGVTLTIKAIPTAYLTGQLAWNGLTWGYADPIFVCRNEDENADGILGSTEDDNGDGVLWPGNVISVSPGSVQTVNGLATISLVYAESYAPWVALKLTASATVSGTESKTEASFIVAPASEDVSDSKVPPAGVVSPFGLSPKAGAVCSLH